MTDLTDIRLKAVVASLVENMEDRDGWCGETHIQKTAFFLKRLMGVPLDYDFVIYKHGPYSFDLHADLMAMKANRFLKTESRLPYYGPSFRQGELSDVLIDRFPRTLRQLERQIAFVAEELSGKNVRELERLGTALFITSREPGASVEKRAMLLNGRKPHIPPDVAKAAVIEVDQMKEKAEGNGLLSQE